MGFQYLNHKSKRSHHLIVVIKSLKFPNRPLDQAALENAIKGRKIENFSLLNGKDPSAINNISKRTYVR